MPMVLVCHVCASVTSVIQQFFMCLSRLWGGPGRGSKFLPLNFNTSFQFVFHKMVEYFPRSMLPPTGSRRIPQETAFFPANSRRFRLIPARNRPEIHTEHGSSIPAGKFRTGNRAIPGISSHRKYAGTRPVPTGNSWEHNRIPQERQGKHPYMSENRRPTKRILTRSHNKSVEQKPFTSITTKIRTSSTYRNSISYPLLSDFSARGVSRAAEQPPPPPRKTSAYTSILSQFHLKKLDFL